MVLGIDANCGIGLVRAREGGMQQVQSRALGNYNLKLEDVCGSAFRSFLEEHYLVALSTFYDTGPTYWGVTEGYTSVIDHIVIPQASLASGRVHSYYVDVRKGDMLQLATRLTRIDHRPVLSKIDLQLYYECCPHSSMGWDFDAIMLCLMTGEGRQAFFEDLEKWVNETEGDWELVQDTDPSDAYEMMRNAICDIAQRHFRRRQGAAAPAVQSLVKARVEAVRRRAEFLASGIAAFAGLRMKEGGERSRWIMTAWRCVARLIKATRIATKARQQENDIKHKDYMRNLLNCGGRDDLLYYGKWQS